MWIPHFKTHIYICVYMCLCGLSVERCGFLELVSSQWFVLTLQDEDLGDQSLWIQLLRKHAHGFVHQVSTEDGEELLTDHFSLVTHVTGTRFCPLGVFPAWALPWQVTTHSRMSPKRIWPVLLLLLAAVDSAVLEICWRAVRRHANRVRAVAGVRWQTVGRHIWAVVLVLLLVSLCGASGNGAVRAAAAGCTVLLSYSMSLLKASILVVTHTPGSLHWLTVYRAQTRVQLLMRPTRPQWALIRRRLMARLFLSRCGPLPPVRFVFMIFL